MNEFCNICSKIRNGIDKVPHIDVYSIAEDLLPGFSKKVFCRGCGMSCIEKTSDSKVFLFFKYSGENADNDHGSTIEEWETLNPRP